MFYLYDSFILSLSLRNLFVFSGETNVRYGQVGKWRGTGKNSERQSKISIYYVRKHLFSSKEMELLGKNMKNHMISYYQQS